MVEALLGETGIAAGIRARVTSAAEGNPLFLEQLVAMLVEDGILRPTEGGWHVADEVGDLQVPPTINALLAARLDRLGRDERAVLEPASVVGLEFQRAAVGWLAPPALQAGLETRLGSLERRQLIHEQTAQPRGEVYRFHHILIRDAAYNSLLKRRRAELHERFVEWADAQAAAGELALEIEEILGYHLEQAHRYRAELSPSTSTAWRLGIRASERLAAAGRRADARGDMPATANLLSRAARARPVGDPLRIRLERRRGRGAHRGRRAGRGTSAVRGRAVGSGRRGPPDARQPSPRSATSTCTISPRAGTRPPVAQTRRGGHHDARGGQRPCRSRAGVAHPHQHPLRELRLLGRDEAAERMIEQARLAGDRPMELRALPALATCAQLGPTPVPEAIAIVEGVLAELEGDRKAEAYTLRALANLEAMRGRFDEARALYQASRATLDDLGWRFDAALTSAIASGPVELIAGDLVAAERELRRDYEALSAMGERNYISTTKAFLAEALYRQGRDEEALRDDPGERGDRAPTTTSRRSTCGAASAPSSSRARGTTRTRSGCRARRSASSRPPRTPTRRAMPGSTSRRCSRWPAGPEDADRGGADRRGALPDQGQRRVRRPRPGARPRDRGTEVAALARQRRDLVGHAPCGPAHDPQQPLEDGDAQRRVACRQVPEPLRP